MKIFLEYRKQGSHWSCLSNGLQLTSNQEIEDKIFGDSNPWKYDAVTNDWVKTKINPTKYTLATRETPHTVSYGTLNALFKSETVAENDEGIPISNRELKVALTDVALLTLAEYCECINHTPNNQEYEAVWSAGRMLWLMGYERRLFIFKN